MSTLKPQEDGWSELLESELLDEDVELEELDELDDPAAMTGEFGKAGVGSPKTGPGSAACAPLEALG